MFQSEEAVKLASPWCNRDVQVTDSPYDRGYIAQHSTPGGKPDRET